MNVQGQRVLIFGDSLSSRRSRCDDAHSADQYDVVEGTNRTASAPGDLLASYLLAQGAAAVRVNARVCRSGWNFWQGEDTNRLLRADAAWKPTLLILMLGTNDIGLNLTKDGEALARIVAAYQRLGVQQAVAIGPPTFSIPRLQAGVDDVFKMLQRVPGIEAVVDARPYTSDLLGPTYRTHDNIHFTAAGAAALAPRLAAALGQLAPAPPSAWKPLLWSFGSIFGLGLVAVGAVIINRRRPDARSTSGDLGLTVRTGPRRGALTVPTAEVDRIVDEILTKFDTKACGAQPGAPTSVYVTTATVTDPSNGDLIPVEVQLHPQARGGKGRMTTGVITTRHRGSTVARVATISPDWDRCLDRFDWKRELRQTVAHELAHAADPGLRKRPRTTSHDGSDGAYRQYINDPAEIAANLTTVRNELDYVRISAGDRPDQLLAWHSGRWADIEPWLTPTNKRRFYQMVTAAINEREARRKARSYNTTSDAT